ncbi:MAG: hypothetical protein O7J95_11945 [Planctomycetota bacterium]|nr:hypothetical protein [Planctomycetota bacterium]
MDGTAGLFLMIFFGSLGVGYFVYGKKQAKFVAMVAGVLLCVFPYVVRDPYAQLAIGAGLLAAPFLFRV